MSSIIISSNLYSGELEKFQSNHIICSYLNLEDPKHSDSNLIQVILFNKEEWNKLEKFNYNLNHSIYYYTSIPNESKFLEYVECRCIYVNQRNLSLDFEYKKVNIIETFELKKKIRDEKIYLLMNRL